MKITRKQIIIAIGIGIIIWGIRDAFLLGQTIKLSISFYALMQNAPVWAKIIPVIYCYFIGLNGIAGSLMGIGLVQLKLWSLKTIIIIMVIKFINALVGIMTTVVVISITKKFPMARFTREFIIWSLIITASLIVISVLKNKKLREEFK